MPPPNPVTRIEQVARDLDELAEGIEEYAGPDAKRALQRWSRELREALRELQRSQAGGET